MHKEEIPFAEDISKTEEPQDNYEFQKKECLREMKNLSQVRPGVFVCFKQQPEEKLIKEIEEKGFVVKYTLTYDKGYNCRMRIINPKLTTNTTNEFVVNLEKLEEGFKNLNGDGLEKLVASFFAV